MKGTEQFYYAIKKHRKDEAGEADKKKDGEGDRMLFTNMGRFWYFLLLDFDSL